MLWLSSPKRLLVLSLLLALLALPLSVALAHADGLPATFAGEVDSDGPLIIDPHPDADPQTRSRGNGPAYWIQRMPKTKAVTGITLGDFGQETCPADPTIDLTIEDITNGDPNAGATLFAKSISVPLPATPGRVHFDINYTPSTGWSSTPGKAVLFQQGHTYSFGVGSNCSAFKQTTWAAADPKIETPEGTCIGMLPNEGFNWTDRQWHDSLVSVPTACSNSLNELWPFMPDGWLVSIHPGNAHHIAMTRSTGDLSNVPATPSSPPCGEAAYATLGVIATRVTSHPPDGDEVDDFCSFTQFHAPGVESRYGWSTAVPLVPQFGGGPRLSYLKLETVDWDNTLLQQFRPALKYDSTENYNLEAAEGLTSIRQIAPDCSGDATKLDLPRDVLGDLNYATAKDPACPGTDHLDLDNLLPSGTSYPYLDPETLLSAPVSADDTLNLKGSDTTAYAYDSMNIFSTPAWASRAYGHVVLRASGELWLQYWFWYYYNDGEAFGADDHEGDWEGIQLHFPNALAANPVPDYATYNAHTFWSTCDFAQVEKDEENRPVVYVSRGRHGSYFTWEHTPSDFALFPDGTDARAYTASWPVNTEAISSYTPTWVRWPGRWGSSNGDFTGHGDSPVGPGEKQQFMEPEHADEEARTDLCPTQAQARARTDAPERSVPTAHGTDGDGPGPEVTVTKAGPRAVRVRWTIPQSTGGRVADHLVLGTHATKVLAPAVKAVIDLDGKRKGVIRIALPEAKGPYELVGRILWQDGATSDEAIAAVAG